MIHNVDRARENTDHRISGARGIRLIDTAKPIETARDVYRFEMKLPANGYVEFPVTEENVYDHADSVSRRSTRDALLVYIQKQDHQRRRAPAIAADRRSEDADREHGRRETVA